MRLLKFFLIFISTALFIFALVFLLNRSQFTLLFENRDAMDEGGEWVESIYTVNGVADYMHSHPEKTSLLALSSADSADLLAYREDIPRTMGLLSAAIVAAAYESAFESGRFARDQMITIPDITQTLLPGIGESRHQRMVGFARETGFVTGENQIRLEDALELLVRFSSPSLHDYLLLTYGRDEMSEFLGSAGLTSTDTLLPVSGLVLTLSPSVQDKTAEAIIETWAESGRAGFENSVWDYTRRYLEGAERPLWQDSVEREQLRASFADERDKLQLYPKTTARDLAVMLKQVVNGTFISGGVSRRLLRLFRLSMESAPTTEFIDSGALFDDRIGMMGGLGFYTGRSAGNTADTTVIALFFDDLQIAVWFHMSSNLMHQKFMQRLAWDGELSKSFNETGFTK